MYSHEKECILTTTHETNINTRIRIKVPTSLTINNKDRSLQIQKCNVCKVLPHYFKVKLEHILDSVSLSPSYAAIVLPKVGAGGFAMRHTFSTCNKESLLSLSFVSRLIYLDTQHLKLFSCTVKFLNTTLGAVDYSGKGSAA